MSDGQLPDYVRALLEPSAYPHGPSEVRLVQTHISYVFLAGDVVYKTKKPVDFGFIEQLSVETRRRFCEAEVRLNRRTAPGLYRGTEPIRLLRARVGPRRVLGISLEHRPADTSGLELGDQRLFVVVVGIAEFLPADELHTRVARLQALFQQLEHMVAAEQEVPELRDGLALQGGKPRRQAPALLLPLGARPVALEISAVVHVDAPLE